MSGCRTVRVGPGIGGAVHDQQPGRRRNRSPSSAGPVRRQRNHRADLSRPAASRAATRPPIEWPTKHNAFRIEPAADSVERRAGVGAPRRNAGCSTRARGTGPVAPRRRGPAGAATPRRPTSSGRWPAATAAKPRRCAPCRPVGRAHTHELSRLSFGAESQWGRNGPLRSARRCRRCTPARSRAGTG